LKRADRARAEGKALEAVPILESCEERGGTQGALAAFTLGRILLDDLSEPARAADAFERALAMPLPVELVESALARIVEARHRSGEKERARADGESYLERYPDGQYRSRVLEWMSH
jgi:hypothetical protein